MNNSKEVREQIRDNGEIAIFDPKYIGASSFGDEVRINRLIKYFYWLKADPSTKYASYVRCFGYKGVFAEDGGNYSPGEIGWVRVKRQKTYAQKEGLRILNEFCPYYNQIENSVFPDETFNDFVSEYGYEVP